VVDDGEAGPALRVQRALDPDPATGDVVACSTALLTASAPRSRSRRPPSAPSATSQSSAGRAAGPAGPVRGHVGERSGTGRSAAPQQGVIPVALAVALRQLGHGRGSAARGGCQRTAADATSASSANGLARPVRSTSSRRTSAAAHRGQRGRADPRRRPGQAEGPPPGA
jgi:hypothetical protein